MNTLRLVKDLYSYEMIEKAADSFSSLCKISISIDGNYYVCSFDMCKYDELVTIREFENYLIDLINMHGMSVI